ncbi:MAG: hypothetical protein R2862_04635 [Thermoanaerobaculia bacterium]
MKKKVIAVAAQKYRFDPSDEEAIQMWDTTEGMKFTDTFFTRLPRLPRDRRSPHPRGRRHQVSNANIMNVVVEERTKEIDIKMALGARRRYVVGQFLFDAHSSRDQAAPDS